MGKNRMYAFRVATVLMCVLSVFSAGAQSNSDNPVAKSEAMVVSGNARFTVLTPEMIRIEYSSTGQFEDRATFTVVNRNLDLVPFTTVDDGTYLYITTDRLKLKYRKGYDPRTVPASPDNLSVTIDNNKKVGTAQINTKTKLHDGLPPIFFHYTVYHRKNEKSIPRDSHLFPTCTVFKKKNSTVLSV